nr:hypothetical protein [Thermus brevis]
MEVILKGVMEVLKDMQEVKVGCQTRRVYVRLFAWNLHAPTHMEWTADGRLLVVERTTGKVKDATKGGDMEEAKPFAWGLEGPASLCSLSDGRILITEFWGGRIRDITNGGGARACEVVAEGLRAPYSLIYDQRRAKLAVTVSSLRSRSEVLIDPLTGEQTPLVNDIPLVPPHGFEGINPPASWKEFSKEFDPFLAAGCNDWKKVNRVPDLPYSSLLTVADYLVGVPDQGGPFSFTELLEEHCLASGLGFTGGMIDSPTNPEITYITQPTQNSVIAVNVRDRGDYRFEPPLVTGLPLVSCVRLSQDGEQMFACSIVGGVIWLIEGFSANA